MAGARLDGADLSRARMNVNLEGASLKGAKLIEVAGAPDMRNQSMGLTRTVLRSAILDGADLTRADLARADVEFAKLRGAVLVDADLSRAKLGGANLTGADVSGLDLTRADLASAILKDITGKEAIRGLDSAFNLNRVFWK
jgi:uncharacterized protein YjbI with pentapeptide repeats